MKNAMTSSMLACAGVSSKVRWVRADPRTAGSRPTHTFD